MNQRKWEKQHLIHCINVQRSQIHLEAVTLRKSLSPVKQLTGASSDVAGLLGGLAPVAIAALRRGDAPRWLRYGLTVTLPVAIMVLSVTGRKR